MRLRRILLGSLLVFSVIGCSNQLQTLQSNRCATSICPQVVQQGPGLPFVEFPLPVASSQPRGIAVGSDGNLWFTEFGGNKIGKISLNGVITEYPIPTAASGARIIATGLSKTLWFTENNTNKIGKITTAGVITEFTTPTTKSEPLGITLGWSWPALVESCDWTSGNLMHASFELDG